VIFYLTSSDGRGFMGRGVLAGVAHPMTIEQRFHIIGSPSINFDYAVEFHEAEIWPKLVPLDLRQIGCLSYSEERTRREYLGRAS